jgi:hypothetical protein
VREPQLLDTGGINGGPSRTTTLSDGYLTNIVYFIVDQLSPPLAIEIAGMNATEVLTTNFQNAPATFVPADGQPRTVSTNSNASFSDQLTVQGYPPPNFSAGRTQTFTIAGFSGFQNRTITYFPTYATISKTQLIR